MKWFSQRKRFKKISEIIQVESMSDSLRNSLWNTLDIVLWSKDGFVYGKYGFPEIETFSKALWFSFFKEPIYTRPNSNQQILELIRDRFFNFQWYEVYDFIEFVVSYYEENHALTEILNVILERELSGYRIIDGKFVDITDEQEIKMLEEVLKDTKYEGVNAHLKSALSLLSDRKNPDYRNSIKESISAVESMARIITNDSSATLGQALKVLQKDGKLHPALKNGFSSLYGYASDENGIRHAMLEKPNISSADAKYFLMSCTSFVNYLKSKL